VPGHGFAELDADGNHREIVFGDDYELLGYQLTLLNPDWDYAPRGTLISWTAYLARQWADQLSPTAPSIPTTVSPTASAQTGSFPKPWRNARRWPAIASSAARG
jgi:hypothetical protein